MTAPSIDARDRLILALDFPLDKQDPHRPIRADDAHRLVDELDDEIRFVKVGWGLYMAAGQPIVREMIARGKKVFLDLKFGDISETVARLVSVARDDGVSLLTLNGTSQLVRAAAQARAGSDLKVLLVTLLTSLDREDLRELGGAGSVEDYVLQKARVAHDAGGDGVIASGREAEAIRREVGNDLLIVTPGIRPSAAAAHDQKRPVTPATAIAAGADYLVVGRPITHAPDPRAAATAIIEEMQGAFQK